MIPYLLLAADSLAWAAQLSVEVQNSEVWLVRDGRPAQKLGARELREHRCTVTAWARAGNGADNALLGYAGPGRHGAAP